MDVSVFWLVFHIDLFGLYLSLAAFVNQCPVSPQHSYTYDSMCFQRLSLLILNAELCSSIERSSWDLLVSQSLIFSVRRRSSGVSRISSHWFIFAYHFISTDP